MIDKYTKTYNDKICKFCIHCSECSKTLFKVYEYREKISMRCSDYKYIEEIN